MNKYYLYENIKQDRNVKYDKPKRKKNWSCLSYDEKIMLEVRKKYIVDIKKLT